MLNKSIFLFAAFSLLASFLFPQEVRFERITTEQGLSHAEVLKIFKDSKGFIWFCTMGGLNRYDGHNIRKFEYNIRDTNSLASNRVYGIHEDLSGVLWVATESGLHRFDREKENFKRYLYTSDKGNNNLNIYSIWAIHESPRQPGILWLGGFSGGLGKFDVKNEIFTHFDLKTEEQNDRSNRVHHILESDAEPEVLWLATGSGLKKFDLKYNTFKTYRHDPKDSHSISSNMIRSIREFDEEIGILWLATSNSLNRFDIKTEKFNRIVLNSNEIVSLHPSPSEPNVLWIGTWDDGLYKMILPENTGGISSAEYKIFKNEPGNLNSLSGNFVHVIYENIFEPGTIWIGTDAGVNKLVISPNKPAYYNRSYNSDSNMKPVWAFGEDDKGIIWIGTSKGLFSYNSLLKNNINYHKDFLKNIDASIINLIHFSLYEPGIAWIGTEKGIFKFKREGESFSQVFHKHNLPQDLYFAFFESPSQPGILWLGKEKEFIKFDTRTNQIKKYLHSNDTDFGVVIHITEAFDDPNILWLGTLNGIIKFNIEEESFLVYNHNSTDPFSISNNIVSYFHYSKNNPDVLWVATNGGGLNKFQINEGKFYHYTTNNGLGGNNLYGILEDDNDNLWISTTKGLSRFNIKTETFRNFDIYDGLQDNGFNDGAFFKSIRGEMFLGGTYGFNAFYPESIKDNPKLPPIVFTNFTLNNKPVLINIETVDDNASDPLNFKLAKSITETKELELSYKDNFFSFEFAALDYTAPKKNQYAYMMENFDEDWVYTGNSRTAVYTNLDPGSYIFKVKASNSDGIWNEEGASISIIITPPFWKTWWAYTFYFIGFVSVFLFIRKYEMKRIFLRNQLEIEKIEAEKLKEVSNLKSRFFENISHEFRTALTLILGPSEEIIAKSKDKLSQANVRLIKNNSLRLLRLINQILDLAKLESGCMALNYSSISVIEYLRGILFSFESLANENQISLKFNSNDESLEACFDPEKIEQVLYNLISNAIKFTPAEGEVSLTVTFDDDNIFISVKDSGIGIPAGEAHNVFDRFYQIKTSGNNYVEGTGIGLALAKEIVELHKGNISVKSEEGAGAEFIVALPFGKENLKATEVIEAPYYTVDTIGEFIDAEGTKDYGEIFKEEREEIILIIDDNKEVRQFIKRQLESLYKIIESVDGEDGLQRAELAIPDLIISDLMMPKMDGNELCRKLKTNEVTSHIPVILLTAKGGMENKIEGLETGADDFITKPFSSKELLIRVKNLIEQRRKLREKFNNDNLIKSEHVSMLSADKKFLNKVKDVIEKNIGNEYFTVEHLSAEVALSRVQLHRKLKALTNQSAGEIILMVRLQRAADLIKQNAASISEIAFMTGFNTQSYFGKCFKKAYGCSPSEYKGKVLSS